MNICCHQFLFMILMIHNEVSFYRVPQNSLPEYILNVNNLLFEKFPGTCKGIIRIFYLLVFAKLIHSLTFFANILFWFIFGLDIVVWVVPHINQLIYRKNFNRRIFPVSIFPMPYHPATEIALLSWDNPVKVLFWLYYHKCIVENFPAICYLYFAITWNSRVKLVDNSWRLRGLCFKYSELI